MHACLLGISFPVKYDGWGKHRAINETCKYCCGMFLFLSSCSNSGHRANQGQDVSVCAVSLIAYEVQGNSEEAFRHMMFFHAQTGKRNTNFSTVLKTWPALHDLQIYPPTAWVPSIANWQASNFYIQVQLPLLFIINIIHCPLIQPNFSAAYTSTTVIVGDKLKKPSSGKIFSQLSRQLM